MYDSVNMGAIPADAGIVACYSDGRYANETACRQRFPGAQIVTITVTGIPGKRVADCETGDLTPTQAAGWAHNEILSGRRPTIYCNLAAYHPVNVALAAYGLTFGVQVDWWGADYTDFSFLLVGSVATQWISLAGYDISTTNGIWPAARPTPTPTPPPVVRSYPEDSMQTIPVPLFTTDAAGWYATDVVLPAGATPQDCWVVCDAASGYDPNGWHYCAGAPDYQSGSPAPNVARIVFKSAAPSDSFTARVFCSIPA
jgi:hypothetical protein